MDVTTDIGRGDWLRERVGRTPRGDWSVPSGYEAAIRVLHEPALVRDLGPAQSVLRITWAQAATLLGLRLEEGMSWSDLTGSDEDRTPLAAGLDLVVPEQGHLRPEVLAALVRVLAPTEGRGLTAAVWAGWAELQPRSGRGAVGLLGVGAADLGEAAAALEAHDADALTPAQQAIRDGHVLRLPAREYVLLDCDAAELLDPAWVRTAGLGWTPADELPSSRGPATPALLWPADRSWVLTTEVDDPWTTVAGPRDLVDAIRGLDGVETMRVPAPRSR